MSRRRFLRRAAVLILAGAPAVGSGQEPPRLLIKGFSDFVLSAVDSTTDGQARSGIALGQFDLFLSSELAEGLSFLGELVLEFDEQNSAVFDVERVELKYSVSDALAVTLGRMHTPLGYWNETFHHGSWFQTTIERPQLFAFEDEGGILPVHEVGVRLSGGLGGGLGLRYDVSVANGRGRIPDEVANLRDRNDDKALNLLVSFAPSAVSGLRFGAGLYRDKIPLETPLDEKVLGAHLVFVGQRGEFLAEGARVRHSASGRLWETEGLYLQFVWRIAAVKPYYRYDTIHFPAADPFFGERDDLEAHTVGLRWDRWAWTALKLEFGREEEGDVAVDRVAAQVAFAF